MILLPNGCTCSNPSVFPRDWNTATADISLDWYIQYYFRDPEEMDLYPNGLLVIVKGMNSFKTLTDRRQITKKILSDELRSLKDGYNPIKAALQRIAVSSDITGATPFVEALRRVLATLTCVETTRQDIKSVIKYVEASAKTLRYDILPIGKIRRKHLKRILENCNVSNNTFNAYRKYLGILFKELLEYDVVETNYLRDISKKKVVKRIRKILTPEECRMVSDWAFTHDYRFYLLIHTFFHLGSRTTEIFRVKRRHVDLENQTVKVTVMKGNQPFEVEKTIKDIAVPFWREAIKDSEPDDYIFSVGLKPGANKISPSQATRRWKRHVKNKMKIESDWYALKHLNSDQVSKLQGIEAAAVLNSHTSTRTTRIYAINQVKRENEELKKIANKFA